MSEVRPTAEEARHAEIALCVEHGSRFAHLNVEGRLYYCPQTGHHWRQGAKEGGMHAPLRFPKGL